MNIKFQNQINFVIKNKQYFYIGGMLVFLLLTLFIVLIDKPTVYTFDKDIEEEKVCVDCASRLIDGIQVKKSSSTPNLVAVMIDNHIDARPPYGLADARLVYEAEAEGSISRFLAIFALEGESVEIGPVRSARPYFVDWSAEYSTLFTHCGGSPDGLARIRSLGLNDFDEFYNSRYFWRESSRPAPHNILTSKKLISQYLDQKNIKKKMIDPWIYKKESPPTEDSTLKIKIEYSSPNFAPSWRYDKQNNDFIRSVAGESAVDQAGNLIRAKNIIIQNNKSTVVDEKLRLKVVTLGKGKAVVCLDGKCEKGEWQKKTPESRTRYYRENGEEFEFNPGITWIEVIDSDNQLTIE